jgi:hypothetical protein
MEQTSYRPKERYGLLSEENGRRSTMAAKQRCNWETRPLTIKSRKPP